MASSLCHSLQQHGFLEPVKIKIELNLVYSGKFPVSTAVGQRIQSAAKILSNTTGATTTKKIIRRKNVLHSCKLRFIVIQVCHYRKVIADFFTVTVKLHNRKSLIGKYIIYSKGWSYMSKSAPNTASFFCKSIL
jgi:hypothetical protein